MSNSRLTTSQQAALQRHREQAYRMLKVIAKYPSALLSITIIGIFVVLAVFAPQIAPYDPMAHFLTETGQTVGLQPPSLVHPMGTTHLGRDVLSQWIYGSRVSLIVGFASGFSVLVIGSTVGLIAGYYKGTVDLVLMRIVDVLYGIPATPLILVIALFFGPTLWNVVIAMVLVLWRTVARVIRSQTLTLSQRPYIKSARAAGASDARIILFHIVPNLLPLMFIQTTLVISSSIVLEAGISFLGLGAQDIISWGTMLQLTFSTGAIRTAWWWVIPPGLSITLLVLSTFYLSRAVEEITNPEIGSLEQ